MNALEFTNQVGDAPTYFAPRDSDSVTVTLTTPDGRQHPINDVSEVGSDESPWGKRWGAQLPKFETEGLYTVLFDQAGVDTVYKITVEANNG